MSSRRDIEELLPAWVNGTLNEADRAAVESALADDPALRDELQFLELLQEKVQAGAAGSTPGELGWHRLRRGVGEHRDTTAKRGGWWRQAAAAAAAVVILAQAGLLWQANEGGYQMLGGETVAQFQVRFAPDATAADIAELLVREDLEIVSGPGAAGVYRLQAGRSLTTAETDMLLERLAERDGIVAFVARE